MASETKVGLIAGLAFIICFAVILTNRGQIEPFLTQPSILADVERSKTPPAHSVASPRISLPTPKPQRTADMALTRRPTQVRTTQSPSSGADLAFAPTEREAAARKAALRSPQPRASAGSHTSSARPTVGQRVSFDPQQAAQQRRQLQQRLAIAEAQRLAGGAAPTRRLATTPVTTDAVAQPVQRRSVTAQAPLRRDYDRAQQAANPTRRQGKQHTVVSGDTLSKIAGVYYGSKSRSFIEAIFNANRSVLSNPDAIQIGMVLAIPPVASRRLATKNLVAGANSRRASPGAPAKTKPRSFRWYQVKKNDRYASIARKQLGSAARWHELHELNKEKFPDPNRIREGVRIKIPLARSSQHAGGRG